MIIFSYNLQWFSFKFCSIYEITRNYHQLYIHNIFSFSISLLWLCDRHNDGDETEGTSLSSLQDWLDHPETVVQRQKGELYTTVTAVTAMRKQNLCVQNTFHCLSAWTTQALCVFSILLLKILTLSIVIPQNEYGILVTQDIAEVEVECEYHMSGWGITCLSPTKTHQGL